MIRGKARSFRRKGGCWDNAPSPDSQLLPEPTKLSSFQHLTNAAGTNLEQRQPLPKDMK